MRHFAEGSLHVIGLTSKAVGDAVAQFLRRQLPTDVVEHFLERPVSDVGGDVDGLLFVNAAQHNGPYAVFDAGHVAETNKPFAALHRDGADVGGAEAVAAGQADVDFGILAVVVRIIDEITGLDAGNGAVKDGIDVIDGRIVEAQSLAVRQNAHFRRSFAVGTADILDAVDLA